MSETIVIESDDFHYNSENELNETVEQIENSTQELQFNIEFDKNEFDKNEFDKNEFDKNEFNENEYDKQTKKEIMSQNSEIEFNDDLVIEEKKEEKVVSSKKKKKIIIQRVDIEENDIDDEKCKIESETSSCIKETCKNCKINRELLNMVVNLTRKIDNLENEFKEVKKIMTTKIPIPSDEIPPINKKNVLEWLNNYIVPTMTHDEFLENLQVTMTHFEFLLDYKLTDTIQKIIDKNLVKNKDVIYPLYATVEKTGKVYVYSENNVWENVTLDYLCKFVKNIVDKLSQNCILWKKKHSDKTNSDSQFRCQNALLKLYSVSYTQDAMMNRVRHDLCQKMKLVCK